MANITFTEGSGLQNPVFGNAALPLRLLIEKKAEAVEQQSLFPKIFKVENSDNFGEMLYSMTSMQGPRPVGENGDYPNDGYQGGYAAEVIHDTWKDQFSVSREMLADNKKLQLQQTPDVFIASWYRTRELYAFAALACAILGNTSFNFRGKSYGFAAADTLSFFNTGHTSITGGTGNQSNLFADAFSAKALIQAETRMQNFTDDNGNVLAVCPDTIIIPNDGGLKEDVFGAIGADKSPETANNAYNYVYGRWNVIVVPYLNAFIGSAKPWILMDSRYNNVYRSLVWFDREELNIYQEVAGNDALVHKGRARWSVLGNDWRGFCVGGMDGGTQMISA